MTLAFE